MSKPTITSPKYEWEMSAWCIEKANKLVRDLSRVIDNLDITDSEENEECRSSLSGALFNATKLFAFVSGSDWSPKDSDRIVESGSDGYEDVAVRYGILERTQKDGLILARQQGAERLRELISGPASPNRTLCHELLLRLPDTPEFREVAEYLEMVTMGSMRWDDFQNAAIETLNYDYDQLSE